jgi:hypothetical protein
MRDEIIPIFAISAIIVIVCVMMYDMAVKEPKYQEWIVKCRENGGVPSKHQFMNGKYVNTEYLCIKPESIIEVKE